jgi:hypothetical protein
MSRTDTRQRWGKPLKIFVDDREFHREMRQQREWPQNMKFTDNRDPGDGGTRKLSATRESLSPSCSVAWTCTQSPLADIN